MHITEHIRNNCLILTITGRLNLYSRKIFQAILKNAEKDGIQHVIIDLQGVRYLDSVALGLLALAHANLSLHGVEMSLVGPQGAVLEILEITNILKLIPMYETVDEVFGLQVGV